MSSRLADHIRGQAIALKKEATSLNNMDGIIRELEEFHSVQVKLIDTVAALRRLAEDVEMLEKEIYQHDQDWNEFNRQVLREGGDDGSPESSL